MTDMIKPVVRSNRFHKALLFFIFRNRLFNEAHEKGKPCKLKKNSCKLKTKLNQMTVHPNGLKKNKNFCILKMSTHFLNFFKPTKVKRKRTPTKEVESHAVRVQKTVRHC